MAARDRRLARLLVAAAVGLSAFGFAAVRSDPARSAVATSLLERTLLTVRDDPALERNFEFGDIATQRALAGITPSTPVARDRVWELVFGVGTSVYSSNVSPEYRDVGISPLDVDLALSVGTNGDTATEARGFRPAALRAALLRLGAKPGTVAGHAGLVWGAEGSIHINATGKQGLAIGALGEYDRTVLGSDWVVAGRHSAPVADLLGGGGATYASDPVMVATASCLGDVIAALGMDYHGTEIAAGVTRPASATGQRAEVICAVPSGSARGVDIDAATLRQSLSPQTRVGGAFQILQVISRASVSEGSAGSARFVRATLHDRSQTPAGVAVTAFNLGVLPSLLGL